MSLFHAQKLKQGYYLYNSHGDVVSITDSSGVELNRYDYDSWGNLVAQTETMSNPFKYSGEIFDEKTGYYYLRARYYDPKIGRFISEDTYKGQVDNPLSLNRYTYVHNNPLRFVDPSGHYVDEGTGGIGGFTSPEEEYLHWAGVAARRAYTEGIEPEDAVRKYVPAKLQEEVLPTAIVTFNNTVGMNHGDVPDLGLAAPLAGAAAASIKNTGKAVTQGISKVNNMKEFFELDFGKSLENSATKTSARYNGQSIYRIDKKVQNPYLKKGDGFYLDSLHYDHIEVVDSRGKVKAVLNLDGTLNVSKTEQALKQGRTVKW